MPSTLLLPGALLPRDVVRALAEPLAATGLASALARAQLVGDTETDGVPHLAWLAGQLFGQTALPATAPYAWAALAGEPPPADAFIWHADPVHIEPARDHLVLAPLPAPPAADEAEALLGAANALADAAGLAFVRIGERWFLRSSRAWDLATPPLAAALGRPLQDALPAGTDAAAWNRLLTEIQMTWHAHPVNAAREARGEPTVNSVWLHGGGRWAPLPRAAYASVVADDPEWRGAAQAAGLRAARTGEAAGEATLVIRTDLLAPRQLDDWDAWLDALRALDASLAQLVRADALDLVLTGERTLRRLRSRPSDRLKFWRAASAAQVLSE